MSLKVPEVTMKDNASLFRFFTVLAVIAVSLCNSVTMILPIKRHMSVPVRPNATFFLIFPYKGAGYFYTNKQQLFSFMSPISNHLSSQEYLLTLLRLYPWRSVIQNFHNFNATNHNLTLKKKKTKLTLSLQGR